MCRFVRRGLSQRLLRPSRVAAGAVQLLFLFAVEVKRRLDPPKSPRPDGGANELQLIELAAIRRAQLLQMALFHFGNDSRACASLAARRAGGSAVYVSLVRADNPSLYNYCVVRAAREHALHVH